MKAHTGGSMYLHGYVLVGTYYCAPINSFPPKHTGFPGYCQRWLHGLMDNTPAKQPTLKLEPTVNQCQIAATGSHC